MYNKAEAAGQVRQKSFSPILPEMHKSVHFPEQNNMSVIKEPIQKLRADNSQVKK